MRCIPHSALVLGGRSFSIALPAIYFPLLTLICTYPLGGVATPRVERFKGATFPS